MWWCRRRKAEPGKSTGLADGLAEGGPKRAALCLWPRNRWSCTQDPGNAKVTYSWGHSFILWERWSIKRAVEAPKGWGEGASHIQMPSRDCSQQGQRAGLCSVEELGLSPNSGWVFLHCGSAQTWGHEVTWNQILQCPSHASFNCFLHFLWLFPCSHWRVSVTRIGILRNTVKRKKINQSEWGLSGWFRAVSLFPLLVQWLNYILVCSLQGVRGRRGLFLEAWLVAHPALLLLRHKLRSISFFTPPVHWGKGDNRVPDEKCLQQVLYLSQKQMLQALCVFSENSRNPGSHF